MARTRSSYLNELSTADLKLLLAARERIDVLEKEKARLLKELAAIDGELQRLVAGVEKPAPQKAPARKKVARKKTSPMKAQKVSRKTAGKKTTRKTVKKTASRPAQKVAAKPRLEDVVVGIIKRRGQPVSYQDILARIQKGKLFHSKSSNFDNVLRRTLSTSKKLKRAGRGIYDID